jgi:hypothetical protein
MVAIVMRCLQKSPMDRYQSMDEVLAAIGSLAPPVLAPSQLALPPAESLRASRLALGVGLTLALALGVAGTLALVRRPAPMAPAVGPLPTEVTFHIESDPSGATVAMGETILGETPLDVPLAPRVPGEPVTAEFIVARDGYQTSRLSASGIGPRVELKQQLIRLPRLSKPVVVVDPGVAPPLAPLEARRAEEKRPKAAAAPAMPEAVPEKPPAKLLDLDDPLAPQAPPPSADELKRPSP